MKKHNYDLYFFGTPNGFKPLLMLEELKFLSRQPDALPFDFEVKIKKIDISEGAQFAADFLEVSPNNKIPALVDFSPTDGGQPLSLFESGAILHYLAEKYGLFLGSDIREKTEVMVWLFWQMAGFGPMLGQAHHFLMFAKEDVPYGKQRYTQEATRLYGVLDRQLSKHEFVTSCGYSIADISIYPWAKLIDKQGQTDVLTQFPNVSRWLKQISEREAVVKCYDQG